LLLLQLLWVVAVLLLLSMPWQQHPCCWSLLQEFGVVLLAGGFYARA
jgi:hypothetical protein